MGNSSSAPSRDDYSEVDTTVYGDTNLQQDEDALMTTTSTGELRLRSDARLHLRKELFTPSSVNLNGTNLQEQADGQTTEGSKSALDLLDPSAPSKPKMNMDVAVALIQELRRTASPEELVALHRAVSQQNSQDAATQRSTRTSPMASMIRRKSTFTPGEATREAGKSPAKLQKRSPPCAQQTVDKAQTWSREMFSASPLAKLASLEGRGDSPSPESRSVTPINLDKSFIGTHTLGTLRIMNGTASPEPSIRSGMGPRPLPGSPLRENDYYTASEGSGRSSPERESMHTSKSNQSFNSQNIQTPQAISPSRNIFRAPAGIAQDESGESLTPTLTPRGSASTMKVYDLKHASSWHAAASTPNSPASQLYKLEAASNPFLPHQGGEDGETFGNGDKGGEAIFEHHREPDANHQQGETVAGSLASQDIPDDDESVYSLKFSQAIREVSPDQGMQESQAAWANAEQDVPKISPGNMGRLRPKADSGYASSSSLRSLRDCNTQKDLPSVPRPAPVRYYSQHRQYSEPPPRNFYPSEPRDISVSTIDAVKIISPRPSTEPQRQPERPIVITPPSLTPPIHTFSSASAPTTSEKSEPLLRAGRKKLQKKHRPMSYHSYSAPLILPTSTSKGFEGVPSVPLDLVVKFNDRLRRQPGIDHLEQGQLRDSVRTPSPVFDVQIQFPSPSRSPERRPLQGEQRRVSFGDRILKPNIFRRRSDNGREPYPGRPRGSHEHLPPVAIADLGSVAGTLGTSPYDLAIGPRIRGPTSQPATHPHQMSSMRVRGLTGMSDKAASEFAQRRSRDRLANMANALPPRPKSFYGHASDSFEALPSSKVRPRSFHSNQSPVPLLPREYAMRPQTHREFWQNCPQQDPVKSPYPQDMLMKPQPCIPADNVEPVFQSYGTPERKEVDEPPADWSNSARAWRMRRKSISENLGNQEEDPEDGRRPKLARPKSEGEGLRYQRSRGQQTVNQQIRPTPPEILDLRKLMQGPTPPPHPQREAPTLPPPTASDPSNILHNFTQSQTRLSLLRSPSPATTIASVNSGPYSRTTSPAPQLPSLPNLSPIMTMNPAWEASNVRSSSPTPSVLERAAFFDTVAKGIGRTPSPTVGGVSEKPRPPSPVRGPREYLVSMSKFNVNSRALRTGET